MMGIINPTDLGQTKRNAAVLVLSYINTLNIMDYHYSILELVVRLFTGVLFFFQGYDKLFNIKLKNVAGAFDYEAQKEHVPRPFVKLMAWFTSVTELACGIMLILGLFKTIALSLLGLDLILVAFAFSVVEPMWDMKHVFPRLALVAALLAFPSGWEVFSIDHLLSK